MRPAGFFNFCSFDCLRCQFIRYHVQLFYEAQALSRSVLVASHMADFTDLDGFSGLPYDPVGVIIVPKKGIAVSMNYGVRVASFGYATKLVALRLN